MKDLFEEKNISPMLLYQVEPFDDKDYIFELKLDGVRCIAYLDDKELVLRNKRNKDVSLLYPELKEIYKCAKTRCILDGELICLKDGKPDFYTLQGRTLMNDKFKISLAARKNPVHFVAYDILYLKNKEITALPLMERKKHLENNIIENNLLSISRYVEEKGIEFFELAKAQQLEGIVGKKKEGKYHIGKRTYDWVKIKVMQDEDLIICGYKLNDKGLVKDLILGIYDDNELVYRGSVSLGISKTDQKTIQNFAKDNTVIRPHFSDKKDVIWLRLKLVGTAHYMQTTESGSMRQPVFKGLRNDKTVRECHL